MIKTIGEEAEMEIKKFDGNPPDYFDKLEKFYAQPKMIEAFLQGCAAANAISLEQLQSLEICYFELIEHWKKELSVEKGCSYYDDCLYAENSYYPIEAVDESYAVICRYWPAKEDADAE
jgi:hypothetical protein